jgi:hypothetical protein
MSASLENTSRHFVADRFWFDVQSFRDLLDREVFFMSCCSTVTTEQHHESNVPLKRVGVHRGFLHEFFAQIHETPMVVFQD